MNYKSSKSTIFLITLYSAYFFIYPTTRSCEAVTINTEELSLPSSSSSSSTSPSPTPWIESLQNNYDCNFILSLHFSFNPTPSYNHELYNYYNNIDLIEKQMLNSKTTEIHSEFLAPTNKNTTKYESIFQQFQRRNTMRPNRFDNNYCKILLISVQCSTNSEWILNLPVANQQNNKEDPNENNDKNDNVNQNQNQIREDRTNQLLEKLSIVGAFYRDIFIFRGDPGQCMLLPTDFLKKFRHAWIIPDYLSPPLLGSQQQWQKSKSTSRSALAFVYPPTKRATTDYRLLELNGVHFKLAAISIPPHILIDRATGRITGGTFHEFFTTVAARYNFTIEINTGLFKRGGPGKRQKSGSWTGVIGGLLRNEADITFSGHQVSRYPYLHLTSPLFYDGSMFITAQPQISVRWDSIIGPFTPLVWFFVLLSIIEICLAFLLIMLYRDIIFPQQKLGPYALNDHIPHKTEVYYLTWVVPIGIILEQDVKIPKSIENLLTLWMFAVMVFGTGYKDKLLCFFMLPEMEPIPKTLAELDDAQFKDTNILLDGILMFTRLSSLDSPLVQRLRPRFKVMNNTGECVVAAAIKQSEKESRSVCVGFTPMLLVAMANNLTLNYEFNPTINSPDVVAEVHIPIALRKTSRYIPEWDKIAGWGRDGKFMETAKEVVYMERKQKGKRWLEKERLEDPSGRNSTGGRIHKKLEDIMTALSETAIPLQMKQFYAIFILHFICCALFSLGFFVEMDWIGKKFLSKVIASHYDGVGGSARGNRVINFKGNLRKRGSSGISNSNVAETRPNSISAPRDQVLESLETSLETEE